MAKRIQWSSIAEAPIACALVGSFLMHFIFVLLSGNLLSQDKPEPRPAARKFKIAMVKRDPQPEKKSAIKLQQEEKPGEVAPEILRKPRSSYSAAKIEPREITVKPASPKAVEPATMSPQNIPPLRKPYQRSGASAVADVPAPNIKRLEKPEIRQGSPLKIASSRAKTAWPAGVSPLPGPVKSAPVASRVSGREAAVHKSPDGAARFFSNSRPVAAAAVSSRHVERGRQIRENSGSLAPGLPKAQKIAASAARVAGHKNPADYKTGKQTDFNPNNFQRMNPRTLDRKPDVLSRRAEIIHATGAAVAANLPAPRQATEIADGGVLKSYLQNLQGAIAAAKRYPEAAREAGQEGKVAIRFTVMKNGEVQNIVLVSKTDYPELDREAIAAVKRAAPFPGLPDEIGKPFLEIVLPFKFQLQE